MRRIDSRPPADLEGQMHGAAVLPLLLEVLTHVLKVGDQGAVAILLSLLDDAGDGLLAVDVESDILGVHGSLPGTRFLWRSRNDHVLYSSNLSLGGSNFIAYARPKAGIRIGPSLPPLS